MVLLEFALELFLVLQSLSYLGVDFDQLLHDKYKPRIIY
jgi:hypothetical protein